MKVTTVRLSEQLRREADRCREREGLTVNALIAVALREYVDRKRALEGGGVVVAAVPMETYQNAQDAARAAAAAKRARKLKVQQGRR